MHILGIETSCDETSAAVVKGGRHIFSNVVVSSLREHSRYGGIIPEIASRRQMECINAVVDEALKEAGIKLKKIDAVAVTETPGLIGSLLVGISFAKSLSYALDRPLVNVEHIKAHLYANFLTEKGNKKFKEPKLPAVGLVVSGGHTQLYLVKDTTKFKLLGETRDDAAGEAFDKVARILDLGYPGGPIIDRLARKGRPGPLKFNAGKSTGSYEFSFSGVKTAVLYHHRDNAPLSRQQTADVAKAFQDSVVGVLVERSIQACREHGIRTLLVGGGVAANSQLRDELGLYAAQSGINVHFPSLPLCLDNAAMIAGMGYHLLKQAGKRR